MNTERESVGLRCGVVVLAMVLGVGSSPVVGAEGGLVLSPANPALSRYALPAAPRPVGLVLRKGDRLAICGDSITEQKMYSRIIETYLTVCRPDLAVLVRQYGWSGERAPGFLGRMTNDCLRFAPTVATICYGMNDHEYRPYEDRIGAVYRSNLVGIVRAFDAVGARVIVGSPGCVGLVPRWSQTPTNAVDALNENLGVLRNIALEVAGQEKAGFADVFWPMLTSSVRGRELYGNDYAVAGKDGVHPDWSGQLVMAYAFLKAMGLDGDLGGYEWDEANGKAMAFGAHKVVSVKGGELTLLSRQYPFCATGPVDKDGSLRSGMTLVPFQRELNRLTLRVRNPKSSRYRVSWGAGSRLFDAGQLEAGVNLAEAFEVNPFSEAFGRVDKAVLAKQEYETRQVKQLFHGPEGKANMATTVALTESVRSPLVEAVRKAFVPVTHTLLIRAE